MNKISFIKETQFNVEDIKSFILSIPTETFITAVYFKDNFNIFINRLYENNLILVVHKGNTLLGTLCFCFLDKDESYYVNKSNWELPKNILSGNVFYVAVGVLTNSFSMWRLKKFIKENISLVKIKEVLWFRKKWYRKEMIKCN